jgi:hypothetical protein
MREAPAAGERIDLHGACVAPDFASVAPFADGNDESSPVLRLRNR